MAYKALENKAFHQGAYIGYVEMDGSPWTTNGHMMVRQAIPKDELKPIKGQQERRLQEPVPIVDKIMETLRGSDTIVTKPEDINEWTNEAGLLLITGTGLHHPSKTTLSVTVQQVYVDYINARYENCEWWMTPFSMFAAVGNQVVAVVAPVKDISKEGDSNET